MREHIATNAEAHRRYRYLFFPLSTFALEIPVIYNYHNQQMDVQMELDQQSELGRKYEHK